MGMGRTKRANRRKEYILRKKRASKYLRFHDYPSIDKATDGWVRVSSAYELVRAWYIARHGREYDRDAMVAKFVSAPCACSNPICCGNPRRLVGRLQAKKTVQEKKADIDYKEMLDYFYDYYIYDKEMDALNEIEYEELLKELEKEDNLLDHNI